MKKTIWGPRFYQFGERLTMREVSSIMSVNEDAFDHFEKARMKHGTSVVQSMVGGFLLGWPLGAAIRGGDPPWVFAVIGGSLILLSIPLDISFNKHANRALEIYNGSESTAATKVKVNAVFCGSRVGVVVRF